MERNPKVRCSRPSFLMWLAGDYTTKLKLPRAFVQKYGEFLPHSAKLRTSSGATWVVKLDHEDKYYFTEGWNNFAKYMKLKTLEFLVFWFNVDDSTFDVSVYGTNFSEREISQGKRKCETGGEGSRAKRAKLEQSNSEEECTRKRRGVEKQRSIGHEKAIAFASAHTFRNPFFISLMQPSYVTAAAYLNVPLQLARQNLPGKRTYLSLRLENGQMWRVKCIIREDYRKVAKLSAGWKDFAMDNGLKVGDACFFEITEKAKDIVWNVTIFCNDD